MGDDSATNALVILGLVLLIVGGVGFIYGQLALQDEAGSDSDGGVIEISFGGEEDGDPEAQRLRLVRLAGVVLGSIGAVVALVGGVSG